ncbi:angiotensin-converting enzyme-like [Tubulanus polymorphus]|uniref:angiotensin-converting enzyme-like n=1 Tax=Tubulanus polymorphus TaxID=672921 RepID=UPI003DA443FE
MNHGFIRLTIGLLCVSLILLEIRCSQLTRLEDEFLERVLREQESAEEWLRQYDQGLTNWKRRKSIADFNADDDLGNEELRKISLDVGVQFVEWCKGKVNEAQIFTTRFMHLSDDVRRQFKLITLSAALHSENDVKIVEELSQQLEVIYNDATVCVDDDDGTKDCLHLTHLSDILSNSRDYDKLLKVWKGWRDATGPKSRKLFPEVVQLLNKGAREHGYADYGEFWRESDTANKRFDTESLNIWRQVKPLYEQLHAFVRWKLRQVYPHKIPARGLIPAHLLGNMWAQNWQDIVDLMWPYPNAPSLDVSDTMKKKKYTPLRMFKMAEDFYKSIGMNEMTSKFWKNSDIQKPKNRRINCHGTAWDMNSPHRDDYRIMMCTKINMDDLKTVHHEMGHVQYYMAYSNLPALYRSGANAGFHEAVGDTIALSVTTPKHLKKLGLLAETDRFDDYGMMINYLFRQAMAKIIFLPYSLTVETWRWAVFNGSISEQNYNQAWWEYRKYFQGLGPPVERTENDFDAISKYHVAQFTPYIRYFISFIIQFQFQKKLCSCARQTGPIHNCDIYGSEAAGNKFLEMLSKGAALPWQETMQDFDPSSRGKLDASAILNYFAPLHEWLQGHNEKRGIPVGWD